MLFLLLEVVYLLIERGSEAGVNFEGSVDDARLGVVVDHAFAHFECLYTRVAS